MFDNLLGTLRRVLFHRWDGRLQGIVDGGKLAASSGLSVEDSYAEGYRAAYFDAVADLMAEGFITEPAFATPMVATYQPSNEVH